MLDSGDEDRQSSARKPYLRSVSWSDRSPNKPNPCHPRAQPSTKPRPFLPPLQHLSISRRNFKEWPKAGSDDLGVWPNQPTTPGGRTISGSGAKPSGSLMIEVPCREFESNKDRLAFYEKECSRIVDHIYLGSQMVAKDRDILRQHGITHVLNCVGFVCPEYFKGDLVYKTLWLQDSPSEDITSILYDVFDYFEDVREQGGRVLVHCCQGVSRSTSLVIAYLMWRKEQSFEDAFQYVKAARGVTNPNMGFACQLLQCQKRVHATPASPNSVLRMYRMAPHSPYDPLHLVPKMLSHPGKQGLDSRGAFVVHVPSAIYVWVGKYCSSMMSNSARIAAQQVIKYERALGPIVTIKEGEEPSEFWDALSMGELLKDDAEMVDSEEETTGVRDCLAKSDVENRKIDVYDLDFEIFCKALAGGVVPPFTSSGCESETCLPARENGWGRLRRKLADGIMKEFLSPTPTMNCQDTQTSQESQQIPNTLRGFEEPISPTAHLLQATSKTSSPKQIPPDTGDICEEFEQIVHRSNSSLPSPSPCSSPDSFSPYTHNSPTLFNSKSPSLSPSTSDYSSPFTFSPSSSNWSDLSNLSSQPSPSGLECSDYIRSKNSASLTTTDCPLSKETSRSGVEAAIKSWKSLNLCSSCKGVSPSIAERRGSCAPTLKLLSATGEPVCFPSTLVKSWSFSLLDMNNETVSKTDDKEQNHKEIIGVNRDEPMSNTDH